MPRVCLVRATGKLIEYQSDATAGTLLRNAVSGGYLEADVEERVVTEAEYQSLLNAQRDWLTIKTKEIKAEAQRRILTRLPGATLENYQDKELNYLGRERFLNLIETGKYRDANGLLQPARALTTSEVAELGVISSFWTWVEANRRASAEVETDLQASADKANFNVATSTRWPT